MSKARFVQLPNKAIVDLDNIAFVLQAELNKYLIVPKVSISPNVPVLEGDDYDVLVSYLTGEGQLASLKAPSKLAVAAA